MATAGVSQTGKLPLYNMIGKGMGSDAIKILLNGEMTLKIERRHKMMCFCCKGRTIDALTKFVVDLGQCVLIVKDVPAQVCEQCGEASFDNETMQQLGKIANTVRNSGLMEVAIVQYAQSAAKLPT